MLIFTPSCRLLRTMKIEQLLQFSSVITLSSHRLLTITLLSKPLSIWLNIRIGLVFPVLAQWKFFYCIDRFDHIKANKSKFILVMTSVDIYAIMSTIENYENRTVTAIFVSNNSVQSTVTNDNSIKQTVIDLAPNLPN
jgi:hypothetical protein